MRYKLIIFDIDGTITTHISSWRLIHEKLGLWQDRAFKYQEDFHSGKIDYRKFCELDAAHWKGIPESKITNIFKGVRYSKNAKLCIKKLKDHGFKLAAVSTGLQYMPDRIKKEMSFDYAVSNRLVTRNGKLTGGVSIKLAHGTKHEVLETIFKKFGVRPREVISVGDSEGDIPLARESGYSIAFNSTSRELSKLVNYNCKTRDFKDIYRKIIDINGK
ncbi:MAG: HAD-IB family phosphatase [Candidatus Omnitrophota bacterium]